MNELRNLLEHGQAVPCALCGLPMTRDDFARQQGIGMTGPLADIVAHAWHFGDRDGLAKDYEQNTRKLATAYVQANKLEKKK